MKSITKVLIGVVIAIGAIVALIAVGVLDISNLASVLPTIEPHTLPTIEPHVLPTIEPH